MAILAAGALALAACGGDDSGKASNSDTGRNTSNDEAILGAASPAPATGATLKIGFVGDGKSSVIDNTSEIEAAKATVQYLNDYKGGIAGHKVELDTCETKQTPDGGTACGQQMVTDGVAAVLLGVSGQATSVFNPLATTGIPYFAYGVLDPVVAAGATSYLLTNGLGSAIGGPIKLAKDGGFTKAGILASAVPSALDQVKQFAIFYKNAGIDVNVQGVPLDQPDFAPNVQSLIDGGAQQISLIGDPAFCTSAISAMKNAGFQGQVVAIPQCVGEGAAKNAGPDGYKGVKVTTATTDDPNDADVKLFNALMNKYSNGTARGGVAPGGFIAVKAFSDSLEGFTGDPTATNIAAALTGMKTAINLPMGDGITFQCGTKPVSLVPGVCSYSTLLGDLDENGQGSNYQVVDTRSYTSLPGT